MKKIHLFFLLIFVTSCARPLSWDVPTQQNGPYSYGPPTNVEFQVSSNKPGDEATHTLQFDIRAGDLETYQAIITYPDQFTFNGFLALGPVGTQVGSYSVDFDFDSVIDFTIPVYSLNNTSAYGDRDVNGSYNPPLDSTLTYSNTANSHVFTTILPNGGDGNPSTVVGPFTERITAVMNSGILTNPGSADTYVAKGDFTSVDPDNDGPDDSAGEAPQVLNVSRNITIGSKWIVFNAAINVAASSFALTSTSFQNGGFIPIRHTLYGENISTQLSWRNLPQGTAWIVIIMVDIDANDWVHWFIKIPVSTTSLQENAGAWGGANLPPGSTRYYNDFNLHGATYTPGTDYDGPRPPTGTGIHHYVITAYAINADSSVLLGEASITGLYSSD